MPEVNQGDKRIFAEWLGKTLMIQSKLTQKTISMDFYLYVYHPHLVISLKAHLLRQINNEILVSKPNQTIAKTSDVCKHAIKHTLQKRRP